MSYFYFIQCDYELKEAYESNNIVLSYGETKELNMEVQDLMMEAQQSPLLKNLKVSDDMKIIYCKDEMKEFTIDVESWYDDTSSYKEKKYIYSVCFTDNMLERFYHFLCHNVKDVVYYNIVWLGENLILNH